MNEAWDLFHLSLTIQMLRVCSSQTGFFPKYYKEKKVCVQAHLQHFLPWLNAIFLLEILFFIPYDREDLGTLVQRLTFRLPKLIERSISTQHLQFLLMNLKRLLDS